MIDCDVFAYASPPRTATTWIKHALAQAGLPCSGRVHEPHCSGDGKLKLTTVRHPADWLRSYFAAIWPGQIQVDCVDWVRKNFCTGQESFDGFVRAYLQSDWTVGGMIAAYGADAVIRVEDLPWAFAEFLASVDAPTRVQEQCLLIPAANTARNSKLPKWNPSLRARVLEKEYEMIELYCY